MHTPPVHLRRFTFLARIGLTFLVLTLLGGAAASGYYLWLKQENRDLRRGMTIDDVKAHYHGIQSRPPLLVALERNHPAGLPADARSSLLAWLQGTAQDMERAWADPEALDLTPSELIERHCASCHSPAATGPDAHPKVNLAVRDFSQIKDLTVSSTINPMDPTILALSTHTHALSLSTLGIALWILTVFTRWPRVLTGFILALMGLGLAADIGAWWLARDNASWAWAIVIGGGAFNGAVGLSGLLVVLDLWLPCRRAAAAESGSR